MEKNEILKMIDEKINFEFLGKRTDGDWHIYCLKPVVYSDHVGRVNSYIDRLNIANKAKTFNIITENYRKAPEINHYIEIESNEELSTENLRRLAIEKLYYVITKNKCEIGSFRII